MILSRLSAIVIILSSIQSVASETLTTGIEHRERLEELLPGKSQEEILRSAEKGSDWYMVPKWLAGRWRVVHAYQISELNEQTGAENETGKVVAASGEEIFGLQLDLTGNVWTPSVSSERHVGEGNDEQTKSRSNQFISGNDCVVCLRTLESVITVGTQKAAVTSVRRYENIRRIHLLSDGLASAYCDVRDFDSDGMPVRRLNQVVIMRKVEGFKRVDELRERDMYADFSEFLRRTGRANLIPRKT